MPVKGLTQEEIDAATAAVVASGGKSTDRANRLPGETATEANARITAAYKAQPIPELTQEGKAAGATMEFVRTGAGGVGTYKEIFPIGTPIPTERTTAYGNVYDAQGNLISGTGLKAGVPGTATAQTPTGATPTGAGTPTSNSGVTEVSRFQNGDGSVTVTYSNGTKNTFTAATQTGATGATGATGSTGAVAALKTDAQIAAETKTATDKAARQSAYDLLYSEFDRYGLGSLVTPLKDLITSGASPSEFTIRLRETDAYKKRFAANEARIKGGLRALSEAEYIRKEDDYQEVMRRRGLPQSYYSRGDMGIQKGFESLISGDVSSTELEDRIITAQDRVLNANPEIAAQLKQFYPGISNGDILAYALDPVNALNGIKRKITAAEIGAAAGTYGLGTTVGRAEQLAGAGVTEATAQQGFKTISQVGPRAGVLAQYYKQDPYTQETAEKEYFGLTGAREAEMQRKKLTELETRAFQGSAGAGAIARDRAGVI
jgi:hypothetical protein